MPDSAKDPTCTEAGKEADRKCSRCGDVIEGAEIPATGHTEEVIPAIPATCTETGLTEGKKCSVCGETLVAQEEVAALGHDYVEVPGSAVAATCTKDGKEADQKCSRCGDTKTGKTIAATGHTWDKGKVTKKATASAEGVRTYTCTKCGATRTEKIPMLKLGEVTGKNTVVDGSKKTIKVTYNAVDGATDYEISYRVAGTTKWTTKKTGGKTEYTITGLSSKKMYDIKVRAYRKSDNSYGPWTGESHRYISYLVTRKASTPKAGQIKVTWSKDTSASGYIIMYSTKRNMSGAKTVTVAGASKTSKVITGLKKGTKYYVKIRPYKTKNGVKYTGAIKFTLPQSVTIK